MDLDNIKKDADKLTYEVDIGVDELNQYKQQLLEQKKHIEREVLQYQDKIESIDTELLKIQNLLK